MIWCGGAPASGLSLARWLTQRQNVISKHRPVDPRLAVSRGVGLDFERALRADLVALAEARELGLRGLLKAKTDQKSTALSAATLIVAET